MKVYLKTSITPSMMVYDTSGSSEPGLVRQVVQPQVTVTDNDGKPIFVYGDTPEDYTPYLIMGGVVVLVWVLVGRKVIKGLRKK